MSDYDPKTDLLYNLNPEIQPDGNDRYEISCTNISWSNTIRMGQNAVKEMFTSGIKINRIGEKLVLQIINS